MIDMAEGNIKRVVAFRLKPGMDVVPSILEVCKEKNIKNGIILSALGSLNGATFLDPIPREDKPGYYGYGEPLILRGPIELVTASGMICHDDKGEILLHVHGSYSDQYGNAYGGHMTEGNKVLITVDMVIGELEDFEMGRRYDEDLDLYLFNPHK